MIETEIFPRRIRCFAFNEIESQTNAARNYFKFEGKILRRGELYFVQHQAFIFSSNSDEFLFKNY